MKHKKIKIIGIMFCALLLGTIIPAAMATPLNPPSLDAKIRLPNAMVMGKLTNVHKIGKLIVANAVRLRYIERDIDRDRFLDHGVITNQMVMFRDPMGFHLFRIGIDWYVFGHVKQLRFVV